jgi:hypothetical protein
MAFRSSAKANATSGTVTATPSGVSAHDYLCAVFVSDSGTHTQPSGWTIRDAVFLSLDGQNLSLADKDDATGADSFLFSSTTSFGMALICSAWSGRDNAAPRSATPVRTGNGTGAASPISASFTGITASANDDLGVLAGLDQTAADGRWTFSTISGFTPRQDGVNEDYCSGIVLQTQDNVSAGATGSIATTISNSGSGNGEWVGWVVAIKAASGGGGPSNAYLYHQSKQFHFVE